MTPVQFGIIMGVMGTLLLIFIARFIGDTVAIITDWRNERKIKQADGQTVTTVTTQCKTCEKLKAHYALHGSLPALPVTGQKVVDGKRTTYHLIDVKKIRPAAQNLAELERLTGYNPAKERVKKQSNSKR